MTEIACSGLKNRSKATRLYTGEIDGGVTKKRHPETKSIYTGNRLTAIADRESAKADNRVQRVKDWSEATRL